MNIFAAGAGTGNSAKIAADILKRDDMEGFWAEKQWDYQQYSIGHGTRWVEGDKSPITRPEAYRLLMSRISTREAPFVARKLLDAGISFNTGTGSMTSRTWWGQYTAGNMESARRRFLQWNKVEVEGRLVISPGLLRRRKKEWYWLVKGVYNPAAAELDINQLPLT